MQSHSIFSFKWNLISNCFCIISLPLVMCSNVEAEHDNIFTMICTTSKIKIAWLINYMHNNAKYD
jgi:hypothetical protein